MAIHKKFYTTSVRRAAQELVYLGNGQEYTASFEESKLNQLMTEEILQWLVDRDKRQRERIKQFKLERVRNATSVLN